MSTTPTLVNPTEESKLPEASPAPARGKRKSYPRTDAGNAELFADLNSKSLRYDHRRKRWLCGSGHTWRPDSDGLVFRRAKEAARKRLQDAHSIEDTDMHRKEVTWALQSEQTYAVKACLAQAEANESLADAGEGWDSDPYLIAFQNGAVDLRTGKQTASHMGRLEGWLLSVQGTAREAGQACSVNV
jgi:putative DNA primase/helicase